MGEDLVRREADDAVGDYLDLATLFAEAIPGLGGAISNVLGGIATDRKMRRVREVLAGVADDLKDFKSEVSGEYVRTEDFEDLLEEVLRQAARERSADKRKLYRDFVVNAIREPGEQYDEQLEMLRIIGRLSEQHVRVLAAIAKEPPREPTFHAAAPLSVLERRLGDMNEETIARLVRELDDLRLSDLSERVRTLMTGRGAEELRSAVTPLGHRVLGVARR